MEFAPLDELYLRWLYVQVASARLKNPTRTYWKLLRQFYSTEFRWYVPNDDNRVEDALELRFEFLEMTPEADPDQNWLEEAASFLEMLVALSRRLSFADERASSQAWFWQLLENVQAVYPDSEYVGDAPLTVAHILETLNNRTYGSDGKGGLFPLERTNMDQRKVELWSQMQSYLLERS